MEQSNLLPFYKKCNLTVCNNYRGIAPLDTEYKTVLKRKLVLRVEEPLGDL